MCGYIGFADLIDNKQNIAENMLKRIAHRGPDGEDYYIDEAIALGFCRLSIIDIDGGNQPMFNEDGSLVLVFNGEIYNYKELHDELILKGHTFANMSDSEVLLHGYEEYGKDLPKMLRGMFSFVIWDKNSKSIFGARDVFGIKPLYYTKMNNSFIFGSEIKAFFEHPCCKKELNERILEVYLSFQYNPDDETFFKGIFKLPPSHSFTYTANSGITIERYKSFEFNPDESLDMDTCAKQIDEAMNNSVNAHKISDVEVGCFLSGGVDSSYITSSAMVDKTFSVGFDGAKYDETVFAKELSDKLGIANYSHRITPAEYWGSISTAQYHMDEPLADPSCIALYHVCRIASQQLKVVLSGEGADELFGGYRIYHEPFDMQSYDRIPMFLRRFVGIVARHLPAQTGLNFLVRRGRPLEERFIGNAYIYQDYERKKYLKNKVVKPLGDYTKELFEKTVGKDSATRMQYVDINRWLVGDILLKADKMSMAHSLELRVPFLDRVVGEVATTIPVKCKINHDNTKLSLRKAASEKIKTDAINRNKLGFPVPIREWLKEENYYNIVKAEFLSDIAKRYFKTDKLFKLLDDHKSGKGDYSRKIWVVFIFITWYKQYFNESK